MSTRTNGIDDWTYRVALGITEPDGLTLKRWFDDPPVGVTQDFSASLDLAIPRAEYGSYIVTLVVTATDGAEPASMACGVTLPHHADPSDPPMTGETDLPVVATLHQRSEQSATSVTYFPDGTL